MKKEKRHGVKFPLIKVGNKVVNSQKLHMRVQGVK